jgi:hypothetical protein
MPRREEGLHLDTDPESVPARELWVEALFLTGLVIVPSKQGMYLDFIPPTGLLAVLHPFHTHPPFSESGRVSKNQQLR